VGYTKVFSSVLGGVTRFVSTNMGTAQVRGTGLSSLTRIWKVKN